MADIYQDCFWGVVVWASLMGLLLGSFLNVVILRVPMIEELLDEDEENPLLPKTLMGRSHCPHCGTMIPWYRNIPVIAWLMLRGRAACCQKPIHWRYPVIELLTGVTTGVLVAVFGPTPLAVFFVLIACIMICLVVIDIDHLLLPDALVYPLLWTVLIGAACGVYGNANDAIWGAVAGYAFLAVTAFIFKTIHKKDGVGGGDAKLLACLGALAGVLAIPGIMIGTMVSFALYAVAMKRLGRGIYHPLGPFLILGYLSWVTIGPYYNY